MRKFSKKQYLAAGAAAVIVAGGAGAALAYWSSSGSGTGSAASSNGGSTLSVTQTAAPSNLAPGVAAGDIKFIVTNTSKTENAYVTQVVASIASVTKAPDAAAGTCDNTDYSLTNGTVTIKQDLAPGATTLEQSGPQLVFVNKATNQDACKGATVNLAYVAS